MSVAIGFGPGLMGREAQELGKAKAARLDFATLSRVPRGIWALGFVSMFMDISSEMIHALLPIYLVGAMGASMVMVGVIEGVAEATASIVKIFSGALSDWLGRRKILAVIGYGLAAVTKPIFPLAPSIGWLVSARFIDRIGKGIRGAPRDALVADLAPRGLRGASFGLRQSLDTVGAFVGPLIAVALMWLLADNIPLVFWFAVVPAFIAVALLLFGVEEPQRQPGLRRVANPLAMDELKRLGSTYWWVMAVASVFTLARFSEAFLILKVHSEGLSATFVPLVLIVMNIVYAAAAYPAGVWSDTGGRLPMLAIGIVLLIAGDLVLAFSSGLAGAMFGVVLWGLHLGFTQGLLSSIVADAAPAELRGTAFGMLNLLTGLALLAASVIAGALWDQIGAGGTFVAGAGFATLALFGLLLLNRRISRQGPKVKN